MRDIEAAFEPRRVATLAAVLVCCGAVTLSARAGLPSDTGPGSAGGRAIGLPMLVVLTAAMTFAAMFAVTTIGRLLLGRRLRRRPDDDPEYIPERLPTTIWEKMLVTVLPLALIGLLVTAVATGSHRRPHVSPFAGAVPGTGSQAGKAAAHPAQGDEGGAELAVEIGVVLAVVVIAGVVLGRLLLRRRSDPDDRPARSPGLAVQRAVRGSIADMRAELDPRRAILAAYTTMQDLMTLDGVPRRSSEAPFEYLRRLLIEASAPVDAAVDLTSLFQEAAYSTHRLTEAHRREALSALAEIEEHTHR